MKIGVIGIPGKWSSEELAAVIEKKTGFRLLMRMEDITLDLQKKTVLHKGMDLSELDAVIVKKIGEEYSHHLLDRIEILKIMEHKGTEIFSKPECIAKAVNRLTCTLELIKGDIPIPDTVITEDIDEAINTVTGYDRAVFKPLFTSKARGMTVIESGNDTRKKIVEFQSRNNPVLYIQKMVEFSGMDLGLVFLGGKYFATYARQNKGGSWNTTTHFGGKYAKYEPSEELIELADRAQALFNLDFTCVDIAITPDGPVVFEVSAFGGFRGLLETSNINAAELYVNHVMEKLNHELS